MKVPSINHPKVIYYRRYKTEFMIPEYIFISGQKIISSINPIDMTCVNGGIPLKTSNEMISIIENLNKNVFYMSGECAPIQTTLFNGDNFNKACSILRNMEK